jgi:hypothetical protein
MKHNREFWTRHVGRWRDSGLTQAAYCRRHRLLKGTLGYWASILKKPKRSKTQLVEVGRAEAEGQAVRSPIGKCQWRTKTAHFWRLKIAHSASLGDEHSLRRSDLLGFLA